MSFDFLPRTVTDWIGKRLLETISRYENADSGKIKDYNQKKKEVKEAFLDMFYYRAHWIFLLGITVSFILLLDHLCGGLSNPILYGLGLDGIGALTLSLAVVRGRAGIARDTSEYGGRLVSDTTPALDREELLAESANTIDGMLGGTLLIIGFAIQYYVAF